MRGVRFPRRFVQQPLSSCGPRPGHQGFWGGQSRVPALPARVSVGDGLKKQTRKCITQCKGVTCASKENKAVAGVRRGGGKDCGEEKTSVREEAGSRQVLNCHNGGDFIKGRRGGQGQGEAVSSGQPEWEASWHPSLACTRREREQLPKPRASPGPRLTCRLLERTPCLLPPPGLLPATSAGRAPLEGGRRGGLVDAVFPGPPGAPSRARGRDEPLEDGLSYPGPPATDPLPPALRSIFLSPL